MMASIWKKTFIVVSILDDDYNLKKIPLFLMMATIWKIIIVVSIFDDGYNLQKTITIISIPDDGYAMSCISTMPPHPCGHTQNVNTRQHCGLTFCRYIGWVWWFLFCFWDFLLIPRRLVEVQILVYSKLIPLNLQHWLSLKINHNKFFPIYFCRSLIKVKFPTDQIRPALGSCCRLIDC